MIQALTDTLPAVHHLLTRWYTVFVRVNTNLGILYL